MKNRHLTPTQRRILKLLYVDGSAAFVGGTREFLAYRTEFGLVIKAYQTPEYFLEGRGLLERAPSNAPGRWYRLTQEGSDRAAMLVQKSHPLPEQL